MHQIREVLRLTFDLKMTQRQVARSLGVARGTVSDIVQRAVAHGLLWPRATGMTDVELEGLLYPGPRQGRPAAPDPDFNWIRHELAKDKDVTLQFLWYEYKAAHAQDGLQYSQFCKRYREWGRSLDVVLRILHPAGDKVFVDFAGRKVPIVDPVTGEVWYAPLFVAALGASSYVYAELTRDESERSVCLAHANMFRFLGGVTAAVVPDNMSSAVKQSSRYEPELTRGYAAMAAHFGCAILPARVRKPRDKAVVEVSVQVAQRWILAGLRHRTFFSLSEANEAIRERLEWINQRPFRKMEGSRLSLYETLDRPALRPLPEMPYVYASYTRARVGFDCHVEFERNFYSAPHALVHKEVEVRATDTMVEILFNGGEVASHPRSYGKRDYATVPAHLPEAHRHYLEWTPERLVNWAKTISPMLGALIEQILSSYPHPEQAMRSCMGVMSLTKIYPPERMEAAATRALSVGAKSYRSLRSILENGLDQAPLPETAEQALPEHENLRGSDYYDPFDDDAAVHEGATVEGQTC